MLGVIFFVFFIDFQRGIVYPASVMKNNTTRKRGRPVGAVSFVSVKLKDLNSFLREEALVSVSRIWAESQGLTSSPVLANIVTNDLGSSRNGFDEANPVINIKKNSW